MLFSFFNDLLGLTALKQQVATLTEKLKAQSDFIYQVDKDKAQLAKEKIALEDKVAVLQQENSYNIDFLTKKYNDDLSVLNGTVESLKTALATAETEIPTVQPAFIDGSRAAYLPNVQVLRPDKNIDDVSISNPCDIYTRSNLLSRSLNVSSLRKLPKYQKVVKVWEYVVNKLSYLNDYQDNWQLHPVSILRRKGDCEDGTILFVDACRAVGIPADQAFNSVGDTSFGYHSYPIVFFSEEEIKDTPIAALGAGFYIFESTLDWLPPAPKKLNGSQYWCDGGVANWAYQGRIKPESGSLFNGINMPKTGASNERRRIENGKEKFERIKKHWRD